MLKPMRVTFPKLVEPDSFKDGDPLKYSIRALLPKADKAEQKRIIDAMKKAVTDATHLDAEQKKKAIKTCLVDKDNDYFVFKDGDLKDYAGHEDNFYMNIKRAGEDYKTKSKLPSPACYYPKRPGEKVKLIPDALITSEIYSGSWCRINCSISVIDRPKPGVFLKISEIMKFKDDEQFRSSDFNNDDFDVPADEVEEVEEF